jgi:hypothetical protein
MVSGGGKTVIRQGSSVFSDAARSFGPFLAVGSSGNPAPNRGLIIRPQLAHKGPGGNHQYRKLVPGVERYIILCMDPEVCRVSSLLLSLRD